jgi:hypothetical protein
LQFTPLIEPPAPSEPISDDGVHTHVPFDSAADADIDSLLLSTPTATQVVELAQSTPTRSPPPEESGAITVEVDHDHAPPEAVPTVAID